MYIISGSLFFITFIYLFTGNELLKTFNYSYNNPFTLLFMVISVALGIYFYYLHFSKKRKK